MKCLLLLSVVIAACAVGVRSIRGYREGDRYFYFPGDGDDMLYFVDAQEPADLAFLQVYSRSHESNEYLLFTRTNPTSAEILKYGVKSSITNSSINFSKVTVFLAHGWYADGRNAMNKKLTEAFLFDADVNVIVFDWGTLANRSYITAKLGTTAVGRVLGKFIKWLATLGMSYKRVHLVGFSLGAHLVGSASRETGSLVKRITALDPAGPLWERDISRLVASDAQYVEVIHTETILFGFSDPCGDADFYPNGGYGMPGCIFNPCSHSRAYEYMVSSLKFNHLLANECSNLSDAIFNKCTGKLNPMGNSDLSKSRPGIFRVNTKASYPF